MKLTWWCSATATAWDGRWKPYPGVWLFVFLLAALYWRSVTRRVSGSSAPSAAGPGRIASYVAGVVAVWLATDWPVGALGAGYLLTAHTASFILLSLVAPPLLLFGWPAPRGERKTTNGVAWNAARILTQPLIALALFNVILVVTHLPPVVDGLMPLQLGAFAIDLGWLLGGLALWTPVVRPLVVRNALSYPQQMGYLFLATLVPTVPAAFMTFAAYPLYGLYELAPRVGDIAAIQDQQVAGLSMKIIGDLPFWLAFGIVFFKWAREEDRSTPTRALEGSLPT